MDESAARDPYRPGRPARRTQWLVSALAYHYGLDRGVENEIVVLATGLDQYLQEIFHHLDCQGEGKIPGEEFRLLCEVLGLEREADVEEGAEVWADLPPELTFRQFHAKLCGYFSTRGGAARLPLGQEKRAHRKADPPAEPPEAQEEARRGGGAGSVAKGSCSRECYEEIVALEQAEDRIVKLEEENASLRELVEDMRAALQSSDARSLALQVGLWKSHSNHRKDEGCFIANRKLSSRSHFQTSKCFQNVFKEVELIQNSRDGQIEEAIRFNQELEKELKRSRETLISLEDCNRNLKREQTEMRKKVEEARQAVLKSLGKVKELEAKSSKVPLLQIHIQQLELELQYYRSEAIKFQLPSRGNREPKQGAVVHCSSVLQDRRSPTGDAGIADNVEDQMFRSVEGQAASDEEEEKWTGEQHFRVAEEQKLLARLSCCGSGCDDKMVKKLISYFGNASSEECKNAIVGLVERIAKLSEQLELKECEVNMLESNVKEMKGPLLGELQQKTEETELLKMELQMLETERVRLSLVEEKLLDVLQLLQQLQDLNISKRALGKILLSTLETCYDPQHGKTHIFEVLDTLYQELTACELLRNKPVETAQSHQSLSNPLLISC